MVNHQEVKYLHGLLQESVEAPGALVLFRGESDQVRYVVLPLDNNWNTR